MTPLPATVSARPRETANSAVFVNHLGGSSNAGFTRQEEDASPTALDHFRCVVPRHADGAHHVDLEEPLPIVIRDFEERLRLEDAEVVDEDVGIGDFSNECAGAFACG